MLVEPIEFWLTKFHLIKIQGNPSQTFEPKPTRPTMATAAAFQRGCGTSNTKPMAKPPLGSLFQPSPDTPCFSVYYQPIEHSQPGEREVDAYGIPESRLSSLFHTPNKEWLDKTERVHCAEFPQVIGDVQFAVVKNLNKVRLLVPVAASFAVFGGCCWPVCSLVVSSVVVAGQSVLL